MDRMWAPWRTAYIQNEKPEPGCIFCTKPAQECDRENLIVYRGKYCFALLNLYPYNNGHLMVVPYCHTALMHELCADTIVEMWRVAQTAVQILGERFRAQGFNIGLNLGRAAGAGIDEHLHLHVVPRWSGDTNFMPVIAQAKVISQGLQDAYEALWPLFQERLSKG